MPILTAHLLRRAHLELLAAPVEDAKLVLDGHVLLPLHAAPHQVQAEHEGVGQPLASLAHPEAHGQVPDCQHPVHIDLELLGVEAVGLAGVNLQEMVWLYCYSRGL